jgi:hypothetical protein
MKFQTLSHSDGKALVTSETFMRQVEADINSFFMTNHLHSEGLKASDLDLVLKRNSEEEYELAKLMCELIGWYSTIEKKVRYRFFRFRGKIKRETLRYEFDQLEKEAKEIYADVEPVKKTKPSGGKTAGAAGGRTSKTGVKTEERGTVRNPPRLTFNTALAAAGAHNWPKLAEELSPEEEQLKKLYVAAGYKAVRKNATDAEVDAANTIFSLSTVGGKALEFKEKFEAAGYKIVPVSKEEREAQIRKAREATREPDAKKRWGFL